MMRFLYETSVVVSGLVAYYGYRLIGHRDTAREVWADVEDELCGRRLHP